MGGKGAEKWLKDEYVVEVGLEVVGMCRNRVVFDQQNQNQN
jgi:hypothetical protein